MRALAVDFTLSGGPVLDFSSTVADMPGEAQRALICCGTPAGSDPVLASRGTDLLANALMGFISDDATAQHYANFAAVDALFHIRGTDGRTDGVRAKEILLTPVSLDVTGPRVVYSFVLRDTEGGEIGQSAQL